jgi:hypothetical protein
MKNTSNTAKASNRLEKDMKAAITRPVAPSQTDLDTAKFHELYEKFMATQPGTEEHKQVSDALFSMVFSGQ